MIHIRLVHVHGRLLFLRKSSWSAYENAGCRQAGEDSEATIHDRAPWRRSDDVDDLDRHCRDTARGRPPQYSPLLRVLALSAIPLRLATMAAMHITSVKDVPSPLPAQPLPHHFEA